MEPLPNAFIAALLYLQESLVQLRDGNGAIYPLAKDCTEGIRDPMWLDLPPVKCLGMRCQYLNNVLTSMKNKAMVIVLAVEHQSLIPHLLRCDVEKVKSVLASIEQDGGKCVHLRPKPCWSVHIYLVI